MRDARLSSRPRASADQAQSSLRTPPRDRESGCETTPDRGIPRASPEPRSLQVSSASPVGDAQKTQTKGWVGGGETGRALLLVVEKGVALLVSSRSGERHAPQNVKTHVPLSASEKWRPYCAPAHSRALPGARRTPEAVSLARLAGKRQCLWQPSTRRSPVSGKPRQRQQCVWQDTPEAVSLSASS